MGCLWGAYGVLIREFMGLVLAPPFPKVDFFSLHVKAYIEKKIEILLWVVVRSTNC
jgi:hypothetical protein